MIVTPNSLPATGPVTRADLDALGNPTVELEPTDIQQIGEELAQAASGINYLRNPDFRTWTAGVGPVALSASGWTEVADAWKARGLYEGWDMGGSGGGGGGYITYERAADNVHNDVLYCAKLVGAASGEAAYFGQHLPAAIAAALLPEATLTIELENLTGNTETVELVLFTCDSFQNYGAVTQRLVVTLAMIANNERQTITQTLNLAGLEAYLRNGCILAVRVPGLISASKAWRIFYSKLEPGPVATPRRVERDPVQVPASAIGGGSAGQFLEGDFTVWPTLAGILCVEDEDTYGPRGWAVRPSDGSVTIQRVVASPDAASLFALRVTGHGTATGTVDLIADIPRHLAALARTDLVFSVQVRNDSSGSWAPTLTIETCDTENSFEATTVRATQVFPPCTNGAWTRLDYAFAAGTMTNVANGLRLRLRLPTGALPDPAYTMKLAQAKLARGTSAGAWTQEPLPLPAAAMTGLARGWRARRATATTLTWSVEEAVLADASGRGLFVRGGSGTVDLATTGANALDEGVAAASKWYRVYLIANGESIAALLHRMDDADPPTLPAGYRWSARVGAVRLDGSAELPSFAQVEGWVNLLPTQIHQNNTHAADTWTQVDVVTGADLAIPPDAIAARGSAGVSSSGDVRLLLAAESNALGCLSINIQDTGTAFGGFDGGASPFTIVLSAAQQLWFNEDTGTATVRILVSAFQLW